MLKVKIKSAKSDKYWYASLIGEVMFVYSNNDDPRSSFYVTEDGSTIWKCDCEVVE